MSLQTLTLFLLLTTAAMASTSEEWAKFKVKHGKLYSEEEDTMRSKIWKKNVAMVEKHNSENHTFTMAVNMFSDWTREELNNFPGINRPIKGEMFNQKTFQKMETPDVLDFRNDGLVTRVKHQGNCGSCWAFSTTGAIEGAWAKHKGELVSVSEQQLIDCMESNCKGEWMENAFNYVKLAGGIMSEESYPYKGEEGQCQADPTKFVVTVTQDSKWEQIESDEGQIENALVELGHPISICLGFNDIWASYNGGIFDGSCPLECGHALTLVGYDNRGSQPFWIIKNSWGEEWGESGFMRMKKGSNHCGISELAYYPSF